MIVLLGNYIIHQREQNRRHKQFMKDFEEYDKKISNEVNSISPLFNGMTGLEVRKMMEEDFKKNYKLKKQK
jgi:hypothetical protein